MKRHEVKLSQDHLKRHARYSPETAIEELVWNGLDAGGNRVDVDFEENDIGGIEAIEIRDWGTGIPFTDVPRAFETIGKSLKLERIQRWSDVLHEAQERYRFFSEKLELEASTDEGIRDLQERYPELMSGKGLTKKQEQEGAESDEN